MVTVQRYDVAALCHPAFSLSNRLYTGIFVLLLRKLQQTNILQIDLASTGPLSSDEVFSGKNEEVLSLVVYCISPGPGFLKSDAWCVSLNINPYSVVEDSNFMVYDVLNVRHRGGAKSCLG